MSNYRIRILWEAIILAKVSKKGKRKNSNNKINQFCTMCCAIF